MEVTALSPHVGVEITGIDLAGMTAAELAMVKTAVAEHGVAVFRDQALSPENHIALGWRWGGIDVNNYFPANGGYPEIAEVRKAETQLINIGGGWHTDHSYDQVPAMGSILVARDLPPVGGDTLFAGMGPAYDALPDDIKSQIASMRAVHSADHIYGTDGAYAKTDQAADLKGHDLVTRAVHPVVIRHPVTRRQLLYVNPAFTLHFEGMSRDQSMPLLGRLFAAAMDDRFHGRIVWRPGTVAIWDNRSTWHFAVNDYHGHCRVMHRITLTGEAIAA